VARSLFRLMSAGNVLSLVVASIIYLRPRRGRDVLFLLVNYACTTASLIVPHSNTRRYNISWTVDSHSPVEEYKLFFRRSSEDHELDNNVEQPSQPLQTHQGHTHGNSLYPNYRNNYGNLHWARNDWRDVVLPAIPLSHLYTQSMSYMIRGLVADQQYEAKVQAR
jgi:hypothetical protein